MKVVNAYRYLGMFLYTRLSFTYTFEDLVGKAKKSVIAILRILTLILDPRSPIAIGIEPEC